MGSLEDLISEAFSPIIGHSTSEDHITAHKLYTQLRLENRKYAYLGKLEGIETEKKLNGWTADCVETLLIDGEKHTRTVEIFNPKIYPYTFWCDNTDEGRGYAQDFVAFLDGLYYDGVQNGKERPLKYLMPKVKDNLLKQMEVKRIGNGNSQKERRVLHFWLDCGYHELDQIRWGRFKSSVNNPPELFRKYDLWDYKTDTMGFVVCNDFLAYFLNDLRRLKLHLEEQDKPFKVDMLATVKPNQVDRIKQENGVKNIVTKKEPLKISNSLRRRALLEIWPLGDITS